MTNGKERKKIVLWLAVLALLAAAGFGIAAAVRHNQRPVWDGGYSVHISEVMTDNTTCPNEEGVLCDWVEIENTSSKDFSLAGYYLSDEAGKGKYCFPAGTVVPARGYLVVWCSPDEERDYAPFALRKAGGETVCLMNENRTVLDSAETAACQSGQSLVRSADGTLIPSDTPTPGYPNNEAGARAWQEALAQRSGGSLVLSEIMSTHLQQPAQSRAGRRILRLDRGLQPRRYAGIALRLQALRPDGKNEIYLPGRDARRGRISDRLVRPRR